MTTEGLDLLGAGHEIDLLDGTSPRLVYTFRSLALLEARFGSVAAVQSAIDSTGQGAAFGPLVQVLGAGLVGKGGFEPHIREYQDAKGGRRIADIVYRRRTDGVDLADLLAPGRIKGYTEAFAAALSAALKSPGEDPAPTGATTVSPGLTSSISPSVPSTFSPQPSGTSPSTS